MDLDLSALSDIDFNNPASWPAWFRWVVVGVLSVAILFGGYHYLINPKLQNLASLQKTEVELKQAYEQKKSLAVNLPAYKAQMLEIEERFGIVLQQLPNKTEVPLLLTDISQTGLARGLVFQQFKPGEPKAESFYITLPVSLNVSGSYHQLAEFISDLAALPRIVTLGDIDIRGGDGSALKMSAQLYTYHLEDETIEAAAEEKKAKEKKAKAASG